MSKDDKMISFVILGLAVIILLGRPLVKNKIKKDEIKAEEEKKESETKTEETYEDYVRKIMEKGSKVENNENKSPVRKYTM